MGRAFLTCETKCKISLVVFNFLVAGDSGDFKLFSCQVDNLQQELRTGMAGKDFFLWIRKWDFVNLVILCELGIFLRLSPLMASKTDQARMRRVMQEAMFGGRPCAPVPGREDTNKYRVLMCFVHFARAKMSKALFAFS